MPHIRLSSFGPIARIPVVLPVGGQLLIPRPQFRCLARLPGVLTARDAIIDTGSPFTWFPEAIWANFQAGTDYELLPYPAGYFPPIAVVAGWNFRFRFAKMFAPIVLFDLSTELICPNVIVQFADGNPPLRAPNQPPYFVIGLWGGILDGAKLAIEPNPSTGSVDGTLEF